MSHKPLREGSVHGRFQPFHNGHLEYVLAAQKQCSLLWIGITKFDISEPSPLARIRERPENNPLTYHQRLTMIRAALSESGIGQDEFAFVPFPIETPTKLTQFLPTSVPCFTTVYEEWNKEKILVLQSQGYEVRVLWERQQKAISGGEIRTDIIAGGSRWKAMVPSATVRLAEEFHLAERLRALSNTARV
ncbi:MAG: cytidyltransferase-related domain protein [Acidobacteriaceae bacterium]|nr:cytidyltransferase-related domain protein [Acidobacteriaceae bacterium]